MLALDRNYVREPFVIARCTDELWEGVRCTRPSGHKGSHHRPATNEGAAALSWSSSLSITALARLSVSSARRP